MSEPTNLSLKKKSTCLIPRGARALAIIVKYKEEINSPLLLNCSLHASAEKEDNYRGVALRLRDIGVNNIRLSFPWGPQRNEANQIGGNLTKEQ